MKKYDFNSFIMIINCKTNNSKRRSLSENMDFDNNFHSLNHYK